MLVILVLVSYKEHVDDRESVRQNGASLCHLLIRIICFKNFYIGFQKSDLKLLTEGNLKAQEKSRTVAKIHIHSHDIHDSNATIC